MQLQRTLAAAPSTTRGRALLLSGNGDTLAWCNGKSVLLFNVKTRAVETFNEHTAACTAARFTAGGDHVASGDASGCVRVWNVATKKCVAQVPALSGAVNDVFVDRDLKTVYVCGEGRGRFAGAFNADGKLLCNLTGLTRPGNALDVSGDGLRVATGDDAGGCFAHDAAAPFKQRFCVQDQGGRAVNCVRFAPGSSTFCSVGGSKALLYSGDGVAPTALAGHTGSVYCVSFAPGGGQLVTVRAAATALLFRCASDASLRAGDHRLELTKQCGCTTQTQRVG
jgi:WD40 repeat protein